MLHDILQYCFFISFVIFFRAKITYIMKKAILKKKIVVLRKYYAGNVVVFFNCILTIIHSLRFYMDLEERSRFISLIPFKSSCIIIFLAGFSHSLTFIIKPHCLTLKFLFKLSNKTYLF